MIELRWALQHRGYIEKERVLQFRTLQTVMYVTGYGKDRTEQRWTEWADVPEVDVPNVPLERNA